MKGVTEMSGKRILLGLSAMALAVSINTTTVFAADICHGRNHAGIQTGAFYEHHTPDCPYGIGIGSCICRTKSAHRHQSDCIFSYGCPRGYDYVPDGGSDGSGYDYTSGGNGGSGYDYTSGGNGGSGYDYTSGGNGGSGYDYTSGGNGGSGYDYTSGGCDYYDYGSHCGGHHGRGHCGR